MDNCSLWNSGELDIVEDLHAERSEDSVQQSDDIDCIF